MRLLIIHEESRSFAGAERMLNHYLAELGRLDWDISVAAVRQSRFGESLPSSVRKIWIDDHRRFSPLVLWRQFRELRQSHGRQSFDLAHAWAARDWPLAALLRRFCGVATVGTLHDHPRARFHSSLRRALMYWPARLGLDQIVCVSEAVRSACAEAGYPAGKLNVVHNGLPGGDGNVVVKTGGSERLRLGFLGVFSERKGLRDLFQIFDAIGESAVEGWEARLAGGAQDAEGEQLVAQLKAEFKGRSWWPGVKWCGWLSSPREFLREIDILVVPSSDFDPFPTVLLEAGWEGVPVVAARVGGIPEIVEDGRTGWIYAPGDVREAARLISISINDRAAAREVGERARQRMVSNFSVGKMVAGYQRIYSTLGAHE